MLGRTLGHYRILEKIGAGGMGVVYRARDERLERDVAIKVLPAGTLGDEAAHKRFRKEALALSQLNHPNIATIHDFDTQDAVDFLVLEHIPGVTLDAQLRAGPLDEKEVLRLGAQLAQGLAAAHEHGVVHRDLKPGNLRVTPDGRLKILDFGVATLRRAPSDATATMGDSQVLAGTLPYMAPEQLRGENADARSDIYAAGVVLHELATGRRPAPQASLAGVSPGLEGILTRCLDKDPARRYQSARELASDLARLGMPVLTPARPRRWLWSTVAGAVVLLALAAAWLLKRPAAHRIESLAVLPLENFSGDSSQNYFADGMTEALIAGLAKVRALRVISRTSVMQYKGRRKPVPEIAHELKVDAIVEGSVLRVGDRVRITAQLIEAATDRHLWAESYERDLANVLALQSEVARAIAAEVRAQLTPQEHGLLAKAHPVNPQAYDLYLRAKQEKPQQAIQLLERAVAIDPAFATGHAELARAYCLRFFGQAPQEQKELEPKAYRELEQALALDPDLTEAYLARGQLLWTPANHFPHEQAIREFRRALDLNPNSDEAHVQLAMVYNHVGLLEEALDHTRQAIAINPSAAGANMQILLALAGLGRYEQALQLSRTGSFGGALPLLQLGRYDEARAVVEGLPPQAEIGGVAAGLRAMLFAATGREREAEANIQAAAQHKDFGHFHHTAYEIACAYARLRKSDLAIQWLRQTADTGYPCYPMFASDPNLNSLRQDPRFAAFLAEMKKLWEHYKAL